MLKMSYVMKLEFCSMQTSFSFKSLLWPQEKTHFWPQPNSFTNTNKFGDELIRFRMLNGEAHSDFT